jgi:hypothetical protein
MKTACLSLAALATGFAYPATPINWPERFACTRRVEMDQQTITNFWYNPFDPSIFFG